jgi:hypothetical protein
VRAIGSACPGWAGVVVAGRAARVGSPQEQARWAGGGARGPNAAVGGDEVEKTATRDDHNTTHTRDVEVGTREKASSDDIEPTNKNVSHNMAATWGRVTCLFERSDGD